MRTQITNYIRAGYPGIYLVSHEEQRVEGELKAVATSLKHKLIDSLCAAFAADREPGMIEISQALADTVPLSKLMAEQIGGLRKWAVGRCRMATSSVNEARGRKIAAQA